MELREILNLCAVKVMGLIFECLKLRVGTHIFLSLRAERILNKNESNVLFVYEGAHYLEGIKAKLIF